MIMDYTYNKLMNLDCFILNKYEKNNIINFYKDTTNVIKKILVDDWISIKLRAKDNDIICFVDKHIKRYRLVVQYN
jgi:hypothetical protein